MKTKFSRNFKRQRNIIINTISISEKLAKYLGTEYIDNGESVFVYAIKDAAGDLFGVKYSDKYGAYEVPNSIIEIHRKTDNEWALVSRFSPKLDMIFPGQNRYFGQLPIYLGGDIEPNYALLALARHYFKNQEKISKRIENSPRFILERLIEDFPSVESLRSLGQFSDFLNSGDLKSLEEKLKEIELSESYAAIKIHKGRKIVNSLEQKYRAAENEQRQKQIEEEKREREQQRLEEITQVTSAKREPTNVHGQGIAGYRRDIGFSVRSIWEANYARVLMFKGVSFSYEPKAFELDVPEDMSVFFDGKEKVSYTPDFQIKDTNKFVEVKGDWFNFSGEEAMAKTILFRRQNPNLELNVIGVKEYRNLEEQFKSKINGSLVFCGWETGGRAQGHNLSTSPKDFE